MMWHNIKKVHAILFIVWAVAMLTSTPSSAAMIHADKDTLHIMGTIESGDSANVMLHVKAFRIANVILVSNGGIAREGVAIAYILHGEGVDTYAIGDCISACAMIWLAGRDRGSYKDSRVLQHGVYTQEGKNLSPEGQAVWSDILSRLYETIAPNLKKKLIDQLDKPIDQYIKLNETKL